MVQPISTALLLAAALLAPAGLLAAEARDGARAFNAGEYAKAEEAFQGATRQNPADFDQWYNLGVSQYKQGQLNEAKESFSRASQHPQADGKLRALYNLGNTEAMLQKFDAAKQAYQQALSYDLNNKAVRENLAWVDEQLKNPPPPQEQQQQQDQKNDPKNQQQDQKDQQQQNSDQQQQQKNATPQPSQDKQQPSGASQKQEEKKDPAQGGKENSQQQPSTGDKEEKGQNGQSSQAKDEGRQLERDEAERVLRQVDDQLGKNRQLPAGGGEVKDQTHDW